MKQNRNILIYCCLLLLFLVPTFLINNNTTHNWGDDFAQYIHQAKLIKYSEIPDTKVINIGAYGSEKRGILFSAVLAMVPAEKGIKPYLEIVFLFFLLSSIAVFLFFCRNLPPFLSFALTLSVYFNYHMIQMKEVVMTEFAFMLLLYFILWFIEKHKNKSFPFLIGISFSLLCGFRSVGLVFFAAYLLIELFRKDQTLKEKVKPIFKTLLAFVVTFVVLNFCLLWHHKNGEPFYYASVFSDKLSIHSIFENIREYAVHFQLLFEQELPAWLNILLFAAIFVFLSVGLFNAFRKGADFKLIAFLCYLLFLMIYPYNGACIRFLIPILPLILLYVAQGVLQTLNVISSLKKHSKVIALSFITMLILSNAKTLWIDAQENKNEFGPYKQSIRNDFSKIKKTIPPTSSIAFSKPFIVNLFCKRDAYYCTEDNIQQVKQQANYVLLVKDERLDEVYQPRLNQKVSGSDTLELEHFLLIKTH